jgi:hypothetical protein
MSYDIALSGRAEPRELRMPDGLRDELLELDVGASISGSTSRRYVPGATEGIVTLVDLPSKWQTEPSELV